MGDGVDGFPTVSRSGVSICGTTGAESNVMAEITPQTPEKDAESWLH